MGTKLKLTFFLDRISNAFFAGGSIKITSSNPFNQPAINPNLLSTDFDLFTMVEAFKAAGRFLSASAWEDYVIAKFGDLANVHSDDDIMKYVRNNAFSSLHGVGTASVSPKRAGWGVVDPDLKVKGVHGLRVIDASVIVSFYHVFADTMRTAA